MKVNQKTKAELESFECYGLRFFSETQEMFWAMAYTKEAKWLLNEYVKEVEE